MEENKKVVVKLERHLWPDEIKEKKKKKRRQILLVSGVVALFISGILIGSQISAMSGSITGNSSEFGKLNTIYEILNNRWYFGKEYTDLPVSLIDDAITGMVENPYDPHTNYMDAQTALSFTNSLSGSFVGIGVQFYDLDGSFIIEKVFKDSPAEKAGVEPGDIIVKVDGNSVEGFSSKELADVVKGEAGSDVTIEFLRGTETITLRITRNKVLNSVFGYMVGDIGVIEMDSFASTSAVEWEAYLKEFEANGIKNLLIDLRNNGGGYLDTTLDIASMLLGPDQVVLQQEDKAGKITPYKTSNRKTYTFDEIVILVNENTASAAEVLTAAIKETIGASVVGVNTYGKGTVQTSIPFSDGSMLKYTIAQWLTPNGNEINNQGIAPDFVVELAPALYVSLPKEFDTVYTYNMVGEPVAVMQKYLDFLGFRVDRTDGYFSEVTLQAYHAYQNQYGIAYSDQLTYDQLLGMFSTVSRYWHENEATLDTQMQKALEVFNGK